MNPPPLLLAAALGLWGYQTGQVVAALTMAFALESSRLTTARLDLSSQDIRRIATFCTLAFLAVGIYFLAGHEIRPAFLALLSWLPAILLPLAMAQRYALAGQVDLGALFLILKPRSDGAGSGVDLTYPYLALCLLSASVAQTHNPWFYAGLVLIAGWALWTVRPRTSSRPVWVASMVLVAALGYGAHLALNGLQHFLMDAALEFLSAGGQTDPYRSTTELGHVGTLKFSDQVLMRVGLPAGEATPVLLHRASYDRYFQRNWIARNATMRPLPRRGGGLVWDPAAGAGQGRRLRIAEYLDNGLGVLSLPLGTSRLSGLTVDAVQRNRLGAVRVSGKAGLLQYRALVAPGSSSPSPPTAADLVVPKQERQILKRIVEALNLKGRPQGQILTAVQHFFAQNFTYSLYREESAQGTALGDFLTRTRAGHCEYFGTGTALLLRAAGIPARYAVGFSVQEFSELEGVYVVRKRHAHAWTRAYVNGQWQDVDTTPPSWRDTEERSASLWEPLADLWSWLVFRYSRWLARGGAGWSPGYLAAPLVPLLAALVWRLGRRRRHLHRRAKPLPGPVVVGPGSDSAFYRIQRRLQDRGLGRETDEPALVWLDRISKLEPALAGSPSLHELLRLHNRYRFHAEGLSPSAGDALVRGVEQWLVDDTKMHVAGVRPPRSGAA